MSATQTNDFVTEVNLTIDIARPCEAAFRGLIQQLTSLNTGENSAPMPLVLEEWPGGRWYRDLGNNTGHHWAHVQSIKPPHLLEFSGPMFMSYAVASNVIVRIAPTESGCTVTFRHQIFGPLPEDYRNGISEGWGRALAGLKDAAEK